MSILWDFFTVLPARAGVILIYRNGDLSQEGTTRTSGGDPIAFILIVFVVSYYPHERG